MAKDGAKEPRSSKDVRKEQIKNSWGIVYDQGDDSPNVFLQDSTAVFWSTQEGRIFKKKNKFLYKLESLLTCVEPSKKLFKIRMKDGEITIEKMGGRVEVDGKLLIHKREIEKGKAEIFLVDKKITLVFEAFCDLTNDQVMSKIQDRFRCVNLLGEGGFGMVYKVYDTEKERFCTVKTAVDEEDTEEMLAEYKMLKMLNHKNCIRLYDFLMVDNFQFIVLELGKGGSMFHKVKKGPLNEKQMLFYFKQVVAGVEYMHKIGMYHRDLKPENILLMTDSDHARVKLIDFGGACQTSDEYEMALLVGSYRYMAPEILYSDINNRHPKYTAKTDVWGIGISMFYVITKMDAYTYNKDLKVYLDKIKKGNVNKSSPLFRACSQDTQKMILSCLDVNPDKRATVKSLANHWN